MSHPNFEITESCSTTIVALKGTIGIVEVDLLDAQLGSIADKKPALVVLDLAGLSMIGSSAMGSLIGFRRDVAKSGGVVRMAAVSPIVRESFKRSLLDKLFKIFDTVQAAIDAPTK
ncbi:MAG: anti-anti-sigma factor [Phycisphaerales bacterium]|nr:anti-anti-sigma factor [Phycisphaerales bacterium]